MMKFLLAALSLPLRTLRLRPSSALMKLLLRALAAFPLALRTLKPLPSSALMKFLLRALAAFPLALRTLKPLPSSALMKLLLLGALGVLGGFIPSLQALPQLDSVAHGDVALQESKQALVITSESPLSAIDWKSFSVQSNEVVWFVLPSSSSAALNRVTGNNLSEIFGHIRANGTIYLLNPHGILFGEQSQLHVGSLIASTHNLSLNDFLEQKFSFSSDSSGTITNLGKIYASEGPIVLMASEIFNHGLLSAPQVALATGKKILLQLDHSPLLFVEVQGNSLGICLKGMIDATQVEEQGGTIYLRSSKKIEIDETATLQAKEGKILLASESLLQRGTLEGEAIAIETNLLYQAGSLLAEKGEVALQTDTYIAPISALIDAKKIAINAKASYFSSGTYRAREMISLDCHRIHLAAAHFYANEGKIDICSRSYGHPPHINAYSTFSAKDGVSLSSPFDAPIISVTPSVSSCIQGVFQLHDPNPTNGASSFGSTIVPLSDGKVAVAKELDSLGGNQAGAVYLFDGDTGALLSTLIGSHDNDHLGSGGIVALTHGNYIVLSPDYNGGVGAVTWRDGSNGSATDANSFFGSTASDFSTIKTAALTNGNVILAIPSWDIPGATVNVGAAFWINGQTGANFQGSFGEAISTANSITGSMAGDQVGSGGITALLSGNAIVASPLWNSNRGAATWMNGETGTIGTVSSGTNSLTGTLANDGVATSIAALSNGHAIVGAPDWNNGQGAATWMSGTAATSDTVSTLNSIVGIANTDRVSSGGLLALEQNGNALILSPEWGMDRGAITWISGTSTSSGEVSALNSITGREGTAEAAGSGGGAALSNGNALIASPNWDSGKGAATWINGLDGKDNLEAYESIDTNNSFTGTNDSDAIGSGGVVAFTVGGNGAIISPEWNNQRGAVTWINGENGSTTTSLVGSTIGDQVGSGGVIPLSVNGNAVVSSPHWGGELGAVTWIDGTSPTSGTISPSNSLIGAEPGDQISSLGILALSNGDFIVKSTLGDNEVGALTFGSGTTGDYCGTFHLIEPTNSLIGPNDFTQLTSTVDNPSAESYFFRFANESGSPAVFGVNYFVSPNFTVTVSEETSLNYAIAITEQFARTFPGPLTGYEPFYTLSPREQFGLPLSLVLLKLWTPPKVTHED